MLPGRERPAGALTDSLHHRIQSTVQQPSSLSCTERLAENRGPGLAIQYQDTSHRNLRLCLFREAIDLSRFKVVSSAALRHLDMDVEVHVIGASHLVRCRRWSELLSCAGGSEMAPVFALGPDFSGRQPFRYLDGILRFEFELRLLSTGGASGPDRLDRAQARISRYPVHLASEFATEKAGHCPPVTCLGVRPLERGLEVSSLHYYPQESTGVLSRSVTTVR